MTRNYRFEECAWTMEGNSLSYREGVDPKCLESLVKPELAFHFLNFYIQSCTVRHDYVFQEI